MSVIPHHVGEIFDDVEDSFWFVHKLSMDVMNEHAPIKKRYIKHMQAPFMNNTLRKSINVKGMLCRRNEKFHNKHNWELYRKQRNLCTKIRKQSIRTYMLKTCTERKQMNGTVFWDMMKPLISDKGSKSNTNITLIDDSKIINDSKDVCCMFNQYFVNVTRGIGVHDPIIESDTIDSILNAYNDHESVLYVKNNLASPDHFHFAHVSPKYVLSVIQSINAKKATGYDMMPPKLVKLSSPYLCYPLCTIINICIDQGVFPDSMKHAEIVPIFKKGDKMEKSNYRPVSILSCLSKIFEKILITQLSEYFDDIFSPHMSGFRKAHGCQDVLLYFTNNAKLSLDDRSVTLALLTDLSKAFDCLHYKLLIAKLHAYGVDKNSCQIILNYFTNRKQRVKLGDIKSDWEPIFKGAPQGSLFGPFMYNVFSNDLLCKVNNLPDITVYNYADDTTIACTDVNYDTAHNKLLNASEILLDWFESNNLKANPTKFQLIVFEESNVERSLVVHGANIQSSSSVKLLGVLIDHSLLFTEHISQLCIKAGRKINVLSRLCCSLTTEAKLLLMQSFILSHFNFCSIIWHYCSMRDLRKIEKLQYKALKYVYNDFNSSYTDLRIMANRPLMYIERQRSILLEVYKCLNQISPRYLRDMFEIKMMPYNLRNESIVILPKYNFIKYVKYSILYDGAALWNALDKKIVNAQSVADFKTMMQTWGGITCSCTVCKPCCLNNM